MKHASTSRLVTIMGLVALWMLIGGRAMAADATPIPDTGRFIEVAPTMRMSGRSVQLRQFIVEQPVDKVVAFYRKAFGDHRVEPELAGHRVVATLRGNTFVTVQLTAADATHTTGIILETPMQRPDANAPVDTLRSSLPIESRVGSDYEFEDAGRQARMLVFDNAHSSQANVESVRALMQDRSMSEQRDKTVLNDAGGTSRTIWYGGPGGEAIAVFSEKGERRMVVLNMMSRLEAK